MSLVLSSSLEVYSVMNDVVSLFKTLIYLLTGKTEGLVYERLNEDRRF
jgi:hypothetical protein